MIYAVYCYLAIVIYYSIYLSRNFEGLPVPFWKIIVYSCVCPALLLTHCISYVMGKIGIHIVMFYTIEVNTPEDDKEEM